MQGRLMDNISNAWNVNIKIKKYCKYGLVLKMQEFDESGNLLKEKKQLSDEEKCIFEKRVACYEGRTNHTENWKRVY